MCTFRPVDGTVLFGVDWLSVDAYRDTASLEIELPLHFAVHTGKDTE